MRHAGHAVTFDWSTSTFPTNAVHWAAFYSDCEHEVKELTAGHRVTLTYNLYHAPGGASDMATPSLPCKPRRCHSTTSSTRA